MLYYCIALLLALLPRQPLQSLHQRRRMLGETGLRSCKEKLEAGAAVSLRTLVPVKQVN
jgi:hypothetical protein